MWWKAHMVGLFNGHMIALQYRYMVANCMFNTCMVIQSQSQLMTWSYGDTVIWWHGDMVAW